MSKWIISVSKSHLRSISFHFWMEKKWLQMYFFLNFQSLETEIQTTKSKCSAETHIECNMFALLLKNVQCFYIEKREKEDR
jgi:hypothetical protein